MRVELDILTYTPYRVVCDDCDYVSDNYARLSDALTDINAHRLFIHPARPRFDTPAPMKPSTILHLVS